MQEHRSVQSGTKDPLAHLFIPEVKHRAAIRVHDMEAIHLRGMGNDFMEDSQFIEDLHPRRLQQEARTHGLAFGSALKEHDLVSLPS